MTVFGNTNQTGIDDLKVCSTIGVDSVEMTQAIQQLQTLDDLKTSLTSNGEPPVPIIANKPAAIRVYMQQVEQVTDVKVRLLGVLSQTKSVSLQPNCTADTQRARTGGCQSIDFYVTPPTGTWNAHIQVLATYTMTGYASKVWTNAQISIYPSTQYDSGTPANNSWIRIDSVTFERTPSAVTTGTTCLEPGAARRLGTSRSTATAAAAPWSP